MNPTPELADLLAAYFEFQERIYAYFDYHEDWRILPLQDLSAYHWMLLEDAGGGGQYVYARDPFTPALITEGKAIHGGRIYTQRHLPKWVYRGPAYTLVCADTQTDGNKLLYIFANERECQDKSLKALYRECW